MTDNPLEAVGAEELVERMRQAPDRLWMADLVGQKISVERMKDILTFALSQQTAAVDEAMARRLDDYLAGEFDIRIGKQAAHAALTAALAGQQGGSDNDR